MLLRPLLVVLVLLLDLPLLAAPGSATTRPYPGVTYTHEVRVDPPLHLHSVVIDLADPRMHIRVRPAGPAPEAGDPWTTTLLTPSAIALRDGLDIAVNGDFFIPKDSIPVLGRAVPYFPMNPARPCGVAISDGQTWSPVRGARAAFLVDDRNRLTIGEIKAPPPNTRQAVGGSCQLVHFGRNVSPADDKPAPRTAVGFNKEQNRLVLLVVDGRRPEYSAGLTLPRLADEMIRLGCWEALNLDGGGSSTLVMRNPTTGKIEVLNRPSDGHDLRIPLSVERSVANVLGIQIDRPTLTPYGTRPGQP